MNMFSKPSGLPSDNTLIAKMSDNPKVRDSRIEKIAIHKSRIKPNPNPDLSQPRKSFSSEMIEERRIQLEREGQLEAITVLPGVVWDDGEIGYYLHDGECRWRAFMESDKLEYLEAQIYQGDPTNRYQMLISQLLHNDDGATPLTALERAISYKRLVSETAAEGIENPVEKVAEDLGKKLSYVYEVLSLAEIPDELANFSLQKGIADTRVLSSMLRVNKLGGEEKTKLMLNDIDQAMQESRSVRDVVKDYVKEAKANGNKITKKKGSKKQKPERLITASQVTIKTKSNGQKVLCIETTREVINVNVTDAQLTELC